MLSTSLYNVLIEKTTPIVIGNLKIILKKLTKIGAIDN